MRFKKGELTREAFSVLINDLKSIKTTNKDNKYYLKLLEGNIKDIFGMRKTLEDWLNMKIRTIVSNNPTEFDKLVNSLNETLKIKFTQTHTNILNGIIVYIAVVFYED